MDTFNGNYNTKCEAVKYLKIVFLHLSSIGSNNDPVPSGGWHTIANIDSKYKPALYIKVCGTTSGSDNASSMGMYNISGNAVSIFAYQAISGGSITVTYIAADQ